MSATKAQSPSPSPSQAQSQAMIECVRVSRWYGQIIAVNDLSMTVKSGIVGLLGPNGAGKSTLMKMLVGQLRPSKGEVRVLGARAFGSRATMRRIGYCPEHDGLYEDLTGLEFVTVLTRLHGFSQEESERRAAAALEKFDLANAMHRRLGEYSKGMRQRAKLAQAIAHDPEVLFLDEPLTGCDPLARVKVLEVIKELRDRGACIVVSSHVLYEIEALTSEIVLLHKGNVLAEGDIYQVRALIDKHPHQVRVECDKPRELARALVGAEDIVSLEFDAGALIVKTREPDRCYPAIPEAARTARVTIRSLTSPDNNLQSVFHYLTKDDEAKGAARKKAPVRVKAA
jgi:ABC-2 type transport system ATP-binding protein